MEEPVDLQGIQMATSRGPLEGRCTPLQRQASFFVEPPRVERATTRRQMEV